MKTKNIEIEDILQNNIQSAINELRSIIIDYMKERKIDKYGDIDLQNDINSEKIFDELIDSKVPTYGCEIEDAWYLHSEEFKKSYENAEKDDDPHENNGTVAIYCHIKEKCTNWFNDNIGILIEKYGLDEEEVE